MECKGKLAKRKKGKDKKHKRWRKWFIIGCLRCHNLRIVKSDEKTAKCPRCGYVNKLDWHKIRIFFRADTSGNALYALDGNVFLPHPPIKTSSQSD